MSDLKDVIWRIREKFPVDHAELLDLADRIEALTAENERLRAALNDILTRFEPWSPHDHIADKAARAALEGKQ